MEYPVVVHITLVVPTTFHVAGDDLERRVGEFCNLVLPALKQALHALGTEEVAIAAEIFGQLVAQHQPQYEES